MSVTVSNCQQINQSPLNNSPSKQLYTFPKQQRFKDFNKNSSTAAMYQLPDVKAKRTAGIGYGTKYDFTKFSSKTPAPSSYNIKSIFNQDKKGKTFGVGRENMSQFGPMGKLNDKTPGPGSYNYKSTLTNVKYSMRQKNGNIFSSSFTPGPGEYQSLPTISSTGKFAVSKYKNYGTTTFNPVSSQRFAKDMGDKVPGSSQYNAIDSINTDGKYVMSRHRSSPVRSFGTGMRDTLGINSVATNPGPGAYKQPSEFGHYQSKFAAAAGGQ